MSDAEVAIVVAHGDLAAGLVAAVELITGLGHRFIPLSNAGLGAADIEAMLKAQIERSGARVVFTDLPAGSCNMAACRLLRWRPDLVVVTAVNLPVLLHFASRTDVPAPDAAREAAERGSAALRVLTSPARGH